MRKILGAAAAVAVVVGGAAVALATPVNDITSKATANRAGSSSKPAPFAGTYDFKQSDTAGLRPPPPAFWKWSWKGVQANGSHFPKCTPDEIDAKQSEAVCPKKALIGTIKFHALVGPANDRKVLGAECTSKQMHVYANGPNKATFLIVGPAAGCAGVGYLAPVGGTLSTKGGTTEWTFKWPDNIVHALPGVEGALVSASASFPVTKGADGTPFLTSSRCPGGKRAFTFKILDENGTTTVPANAGACGK